eukprot:UN02327
MLVIYKIYKKYRKALAHILLAVKYNPDSDYVHNNAGWLYHTHFRDLNAAIKHYEHAVKVNPFYFEARFNLACLHQANRP